MEKIALVFMSPKCLDIYANENDFLNPECGKQILSKVVSYFIMTVSLLVKVPQVIKVSYEWCRLNQLFFLTEHKQHWVSI